MTSITWPGPDGTATYRVVIKAGSAFDKNSSFTDLDLELDGGGDSLHFGVDLTGPFDESPLAIAPAAAPPARLLDTAINPKG